MQESFVIGREHKELDIAEIEAHVPYKAICNCNGCTWDVTIKGETVTFTAADVARYFIVPEEGMMYAVLQVRDELPEGEYGVSMQAYLVGAFFDISQAAEIWFALNAEEKPYQKFEIRMFKPNFLYAAGERPNVAGVTCIE